MDPKTFAELGLSPNVQAALDAAGYTSPTPIQASAIPVAVAGRDVLGIAQTGTGKTAAFVLPMITRLETGRARARMPRSLILAPTRELAAQVAQNFEKYGINNKLTLALLIGGVSFDDQNKKLDRGVDVLIATPGRLLDHFQRGRLMLMGVEILVIDEADRMLDMGFIPDIEKICKLLPPVRQTLFFSATMPNEITRLADQFLKEPVRVEAAPPATAAKTITQRFFYCANGEDWAKREVLRELIRESNVKNAIIFCNRKVEVAILLKSLLKHGFNAGALHGDMDQKSRMETLDKFRTGAITFLAASDVAARGLDIPDVSHVFNFDLPRESDDYVHRIGRTGRAGKEGNSASLVAPDDLRVLKDIEKMIGEPVTWLNDAPTEEDYAEAGKRRRGRGGRGAPGGPAGGGRQRSAGGGRERPAGGRRENAAGGGRGPAVGGRGPAVGGRGPAVGGRERSAEGGRPVEDKREISAESGRERSAGGRPDRREPRPMRSRGEARPSQGEQRNRGAGGGEELQRPRQPMMERPADQPGSGQRPQREPRPRTDEQPWVDAPPFGASRHPAAGPQPQEPRGGNHEPRGGRGESRDRQDRGQRPNPQREPRREGGLGFADNVPAFLRKPLRPTKVASE